MRTGGEIVAKPGEIEHERVHEKRCKTCSLRSGAKKDPQSQKIARTAPKNFLNNLRWGYRSLPSKTMVLRQIAPESSPERSAKSLSHSFFVVPFSVPIRGMSALKTLQKPWILRDNRRVKSTPDPDTFGKVSRYSSHFHCNTFAKVCPPFRRKSYIHH